VSATPCGPRSSKRTPIVPSRSAIDRKIAGWVVLSRAAALFILPACTTVIGAGPALTDLLGGQVQVMFGTIVSVIEYVKAGTLRALAVTTSTRADALPDIPAMSDFVPGYEASNWYGVGVPKKTPAGVVDRLNTEINAALVDPKIKSRLADLGSAPLVGSPADFGRLIAEETEKWGTVVRFANVKLG
jgi:tripartite-type tricarboxylate transporter receptor subunit TctC